MNRPGAFVKFADSTNDNWNLIYRIEKYKGHKYVLAVDVTNWKPYKKRADKIKFSFNEQPPQLTNELLSYAISFLSSGSTSTNFSENWLSTEDAHNFLASELEPIKAEIKEAVTEAVKEVVIEAVIEAIESCKRKGRPIEVEVDAKKQQKDETYNSRKKRKST